VAQGETATRGLGPGIARWWARERPTGVALVLFGVRWAAWGVALFIVNLSALPRINVHREPYLLIITFAQNAVASLYLPLMRPRARAVLRRWMGRDVDDILVVSLVDVGLALAIVHLSGGWDSPYYLFAVASLLVPSSILGLRSNLLLALGFDGAYLIILATAGQGTDGPWLREEANNLAVFLATPFLVAVVVQFLSWMSRELAEERETARQALDENIRLQREREELIAQEERSRIAREIHDGIAQSIYMLSLNLETAAEAPPGQPNAGERLQSLVTLAKQTLLEVRHYIFDLRPLLQGDASLSAALRSQVREFATVSGLPVTVAVDGTERALPVAAATALYRIAQEALANVYRHGLASEISLRLAFAAGSVRLEVSDNGVGFAAGDEQALSGRGLRNMRQRAAELGGTLDIASAPGQGTRIAVTIPTG
jgi:signal transduction histidine kinase